MILFLDILLCSIFLCVLAPVPYCFNYHRFIWWPLIWLSKVPSHFSWFFKFFLAVLIHLYTQMNFKSYLSSTTKSYWDFNWNCVKFIYYFREAWHLYNTESSCPEHGVSLYLVKPSFYSSIKFYSFLNVHLAHSYFTCYFTVLLLFIFLLASTCMYKWVMFACLFCIPPSFWALVFVFQWLHAYPKWISNNNTHLPKIVK